MIETRTHESIHDDYDSPWKEALENYFPEFLALFFPAIHDGLDWSYKYEFLDKELQRIVRDAEIGRCYADKLVKAWTPEGRETWIPSMWRYRGNRTRHSTNGCTFTIIVSSTAIGWMW